MKINNNIQKMNSTNFCSLKNLGEKAVTSIQKATTINSVGQRAVIGATALFLQPAINLSNKNIDKKTREQSATRSISRAIFGTLMGILVRGSTIFIANKYAKSGKFLDFKVKDKAVKCLASATEDQIRNYAATMGTILGLFVMLFTNFLVDAPLINMGQNKLTAMLNNYREKKLNKQNEEVKNVSSK